jgi:NitT/TauT family transport system permease protein
MMSENTRVAVWRLSIILVALAVIESAVRLGWISTFFLSAPTRAAIVLWEQIVHGNALWLTGVTLFEIAACLIISTVVGVCAGFLLWRYKLIGTSYEMFLAAVFSSPVILAYPIFLVTFGRSSAAVIALSSIFGLIPIIMNTKGAFQNVSPILLQVGASMNLTRKQMFRHILIPAVAPTIFSGFRLALTYILKSVLGLEYVAQVGGVGMWLSDAAFKFEVEEVYAGLLGTIVLSILFLYLINRSEVLVRK